MVATLSADIRTATSPAQCANSKSRLDRHALVRGSPSGCCTSADKMSALPPLYQPRVVALGGRHLVLAGDTPQVRVRQNVWRRRGVGLVIGPLKSRYARRDLPFRTPGRTLWRSGTAPDGLPFSDGDR